MTASHTPAPDVLELEVERPAVGGRMIARHDGRVVLVAGAIPGERVRAAVERRRRDLLLATTVEVVEPSPDRRPVDGDPACGGRSFAHIAYPRQRALKTAIVEDAFRRIGGLTLEAPAVIASPERGYRMRARLHVTPAGVGFLREGSHDGCGVGGTGQLLPATERVVEALSEAAGTLADAGVSTIELAEDLCGGQRALHAVVAGDLDRAAARLDRVTGLAGVTGWSAGTGRADDRRLAGDVWVIDPLSSFLSAPGAGILSLGRRASSFFQANRYLVPELVGVVVSLAGHRRVVDLYAGVGLFALAVAVARDGGVTAVEGDPTMAADLRRNAEPLAPAVEVVHASVEGFLAGAGDLGDATVIVDPPRAGLSREARTRLLAGAPRQIVSVSCDVATQARDCRALIAAGYRLEALRILDMFPNTAHVETVVLLTCGPGPGSP